jgi:hypothetical protein
MTRFIEAPTWTISLDKRPKQQNMDMNVHEISQVDYHMFPWNTF